MKQHVILTSDANAPGSAARKASVGAADHSPPRPDRPGAAVRVTAGIQTINHSTWAAMVRAHSIDSACVVSTSRS
jgi:hypothetical protein